MNSRILLVTVGAGARDFEPLVLEPGLPLLDHSGSSEEVARSWLKRLIARPEVKKDGNVEFLLCDDENRVVKNTAVEPISKGDLDNDAGLRADLKLLQERLWDVKPANNSEAKLKEVLTKNLETLVDRSSESHQACHFFKYQQAGKSNLVWCWGYQRKDPEMISPMICTNPACESLFLKRNGNVCPQCDQAANRVAARAMAGGGGSAGKWLVGGLLLLAAVGLGYWLKPEAANLPPIGDGEQSDLYVAKPSNWEGPIGASVNLLTTFDSGTGDQPADVTSQTVVVVDDPTVLHLNDSGTAVLAKSVGKTVVHYYFGDQETKSTFIVRAATIPATLEVQPASLAMGAGSAADVKVIGTYADGTTADLTNASDISVEGEAAFESDGRVQAIRKGGAKVRAKYRPNPSENPIEAEADVTVTGQPFNELLLALEHDEIAVGQKAKIAATLQSSEGESQAATGTSDLRLSVSPPHIAKVKGDWIVGVSPGDAILQATHGELKKELSFRVASNEGIATMPLTVTPKQLRLSVGEITELNVSTGSKSPFEIISSAPDVVEVLPDQQVTGRSPGGATLTIRQGEESLEVVAEVTAIDVESIAVKPENLSIPVGETISFQVVGFTPDGDQIEIAPDQLTAVRVPPASHATVDLSDLTVLGVQPTNGSPSRLTLQFQRLKATAEVEVVTAPATIELSPEGKIELPVGQERKIEAFALRGNARTKLEPNQLQWQLDPESVPGLSFDPATGVVKAIKATEKSLSIGATQSGNSSEAIVEVRAIVAEEVAIDLSVPRAKYMVGETGQVNVDLNSESGSVAPSQPVRFATSEPSVLRVDPTTGAFKAMKPGTATVTASHSMAKEKASTDLQVIEQETAKLIFQPAEINVAVGSRVELQLMLVSNGDKESASPVAVTDEAIRWSFGNKDAASWEPPYLVGQKISKPFEIQAFFKGLKAVGSVEVSSSKPADGNEVAIRIEPSEVELVVNQPFAPTVQQKMPESDQWQEISPELIKWSVPPGVALKQDSKSQRATLTVVSTQPETQTVTAKYLGATSELKIGVLAKAPAIAPNADLIIVREPTGESLPVGQTQSYSVVTKTESESTPIDVVRWMPAYESEFVSWEPPTLTAKQPGGEETLWVEAGGKRIEFKTSTTKAPNVAMTAASKSETGDLVVSPESVAVSVGESLFIHDKLKLTRKDIDVIGQAEFTPSNNRVFRYSEESKSLVGVSPGSAELTVSQGGENVSVIIEVRPADMSELGGEKPATMQVTPSEGELKIGETIPLKVTVQTVGKKELVNRTDSAIIKSSDPKVLKVEGNQVVGVTSGNASVEVSLPGQEPFSASFKVTDGKLSNLSVTPESMKLAVGEQSQLDLSATDQQGKEIEIAASEVVFTIDGENPDSIRVSQTGAVTALKSGIASITTSRGELIKKVSVVVTDSPVEKLRLDPTDGLVAVGKTLDFKVFATREGIEKPVTLADGVTLSLSDDSFAKIDGMAATGVSPGRSSVSVKFKDVTAIGKLRVSKDSEASMAKEMGSIVGLQFRPDSLSLEVDSTATIKIFQADALGSEKEIFNDLDFLVEPSEFAKVELTSDGPVVTALKVGQAKITVKSEDAQSQRPLLVDVVDTPIEDATLVAQPATLQIAIKETKNLDSLEVHFSENQQPLSVAPTLKSSDESIVKVRPDGSVVGVAEGNASISVTTKQEPYQSLATEIPVTVVAGAPPSSMLKNEQENAETELVLTGPPETTVDALVSYKVMMVSDNDQIDVTNDETELVVGVNENDFIAILPGCRAKALRPGSVTLRAKHKGLISNPVSLQISDLSEKFASLELRFSETPMSVGQTRSYTLWGVPENGGRPQDMTARVTNDIEDKNNPRVAIQQTVANADSDASKDGDVETVGQVVKHEPPTIVATGPGEMRIIAALGGIKSTMRKVTVVPTDHRDMTLRAEPSQVTVRVGKTMQPVVVYANRAKSQPTSVDAQLVSNDESILKADPKSPGSFIGVNPGQTTITASFNGQTTSIEVNVVGVRFESVALEDVELTEDGFTLQVSIKGRQPDGDLEYRVVSPGSDAEIPWKVATIQGQQIDVKIPAPDLTRGGKDKVYQVILESRRKDGGAVERYPCSFRLLIDAKRATDK